MILQKEKNINNENSKCFNVQQKKTLCFFHFFSILYTFEKIKKKFINLKNVNDPVD